MNDLEYKKWKLGDWIYINRLQWGKEEIDKILECLNENWFAGNSRFNKEFETKMANFSGLKYFQTTNSGSAALEISIQALIQSGRIKEGDKFLHPIHTFPTSCSTAIMYGMIPVFVDVGVGTYVVDDGEIERAFKEFSDISFAIIPALMGNVPNMELLLEKLDGKPLILDSCDLMGCTWDTKEFASYGTLSCYSFYGSHTVSTAGVGGGIGTNDDELYKIIKSLTFWGRDFETDNLSPVQNFLKRYSYYTKGFDAQMSAIQAAFGLGQMERLYEFLGKRKFIFNKLTDLFKTKLNYFILPTRVSDRADITWFGYPLFIKKEAPFTREEFVEYLVENKVEVRPVMACNLLDNKPYQDIECVVVSNFSNARENQIRSVFIPACPMEQDEFEHYFTILQTFLERY